MAGALHTTVPVCNWTFLMLKDTSTPPIQKLNIRTFNNSILVTKITGKHDWDLGKLRFEGWVYRSHCKNKCGLRYLLVFTILLNPFSRGSVKLRSSNTNDAPIIKSGYFEDNRDVDTMIRGINKFKQLVTTTRFKSLKSSIIKFPIPKCDPLPYPSDEYEKCYIKYFSAFLWHPSGTCKMGKSNDATSVVDSRLKVRGFSYLRVADASVMPVITTGNTQCPTYAIGQKAADLIKAAWM